MNINKNNIELTNIEIEAIRKQILNDMVEGKLLDKYAEEHGISVTEDEIKNEIQTMREYTGLSEDDVYKQALSKYQLLESDINEMVRSALIADKVYYEVVKDLDMSDEEVWDYFKERVRFYNGARRLSHIFMVVDSQNDTIEEINKKYEKMKEIITEELKRTFRPEFLNRIDEVIVFHGLEEGQIFAIVDLMVKELEERLGKLGVKVKISEDTKKYIAKQGFDSVFGARPLERTIRKMNRR